MGMLTGGTMSSASLHVSVLVAPDVTTATVGAALVSRTAEGPGKGRASGVDGRTAALHPASTSTNAAERATLRDPTNEDSS